MNTNVDLYFTEGCGRCPLGGTPDCKVNRWPQELKQLRRIVLDCGLTEESKWGVPCYTFQGNNIGIVSAFKEYASLSFFKGALLQDTNHILEKPGENTQAARLLKFTDVKQVMEMESILKTYIYEAIEVEKAGLKVPLKETSEFNMPAEFKKALYENPDLKTAFEALTPGRQRGYLLHFSQPKQSKTREARIEKCTPMIFERKGLNDR
ncbi:YdeI/OmpD-associated family protein [Roseivirga sp.]|uniref:YdeI/OmpD-associated family protein n=1 Tax=Roseivirga sp. TaxID=1964215 RepID=UPI002B26E96B|nr:YdeI/OmpD-associated family protein [Roseivirga sp.]